jgi:hypothetical protein
VVTGWVSVFSEGDVAFDMAVTLRGWAEQEENRKLKAAAGAAMKLTGKRNGD